MPSGRTHDCITLWGLPFVACLTFEQTRNSKITLLVSGAFLFSGLMFGPDLDLYSIQYKRWGLVRWIWLPYQKLLRHRSLFSHGPIIGTTLRLLYLAIWLAILGLFSLSIATLVWHTPWSWQHLGSVAAQFLNHYQVELLSVYLGLELGAISHVVSDWASSAFKRSSQGQHRGKMKKCKSKNSRPRQSKLAKVKSRQKH